MSIRARGDGRSDRYLCDAKGCEVFRPCSGLPMGWVLGIHGYYHLCPRHRGLLGEMDRQVAEYGVRSLDGHKGPG